MSHTRFPPQKRLALAMLVLGGLALGCSSAAPSTALYVNDLVYLQTWYPFLQEGMSPMDQEFIDKWLAEVGSEVSQSCGRSD